MGVVDLPERIAPAFHRDALNGNIVFKEAQLLQPFGVLERPLGQTGVLRQRLRAEGVETNVMPDVHDVGLAVEGQDFLGEIERAARLTENGRGAADHALGPIGTEQRQGLSRTFHHRGGDADGGVCKGLDHRFDNPGRGQRCIALQVDNDVCALTLFEQVLIGEGDALGTVAATRRGHDRCHPRLIGGRCDQRVIGGNVDTRDASYGLGRLSRVGDDRTPGERCQHLAREARGAHARRNDDDCLYH